MLVLVDSPVLHERSLSACQTRTRWNPNLNPTPTSVLPHPPAMDTFEALRDQVSKITIYDIKSMYNQVRLISSIRPICQRSFLRRRRIWFSTSARWRRKSKRLQMTSLGELRVTCVSYLLLITGDQGSEFVAHARNCSRVSGNRTFLLRLLTFSSSLALLTCELLAFSR